MWWWSLCSFGYQPQIRQCHGSLSLTEMLSDASSSPLRVLKKAGKEKEEPWEINFQTDRRRNLQKMSDGVTRKTQIMAENGRKRTLFSGVSGNFYNVTHIFCSLCVYLWLTELLATQTAKPKNLRLNCIFSPQKHTHTHRTYSGVEFLHVCARVCASMSGGTDLRACVFFFFFFSKQQ